MLAATARRKRGYNLAPMTVEECEALRDELLASMPVTAAPEVLWVELWLKLADGLGEDPELPPRLPSQPDTPQGEIERIQSQVRITLERHGAPAGECLRVFSRAVAERAGGERPG